MSPTNLLKRFTIRVIRKLLTNITRGPFAILVCVYAVKEPERSSHKMQYYVMCKFVKSQKKRFLTIRAATNVGFTQSGYPDDLTN